MRFCFVVGGMNLGGVQTFILNLASHLIASGDKVSVIAIHNKGVWWDRLAESGIEGIAVLRDDFLCPVAHAAGIARIIRERQFDVVFLNHAREAQIGIPLYSHTTTVIPIAHNDTNGALTLALRNRRHSHLIVGVSPLLIEKIKSRSGADHVMQLNYPIAMPTDARFQDRAPWQSNLKLIYVGRLHEEQKGIMVLPEVMRECTRRKLNFTLDIVGSGGDEGRLYEAFKSAHVDDHVNFLGPKTPDDIEPLLLQSHVLLMPSHYEGLGIVAVEAQSAGCVPLAARLPGVTDHSVKHGETGFLIDGHSPKAYADRLADLAADEKRWQRMSRAGRDHAIGNFSISKAGAGFRSSLQHARPVSHSSAITRLVGFVGGAGWRDYVPNSWRAPASTR